MLVTRTIQTSDRNQLLDLTDMLSTLVRHHRITDGLAIVYVPHTTAAVTINENADPDVQSDLLHKLAELIPKSEPYYEHSEGNSDSHLKASLTGNSVTVIIDGEALVLGRWQAIYFAEFDGPRERQVHIKLVDLKK